MSPVKRVKLEIRLLGKAKEEFTRHGCKFPNFATKIQFFFNTVK